MLLKEKNKHIGYFFLSLLSIALLSQGWYNIGFFPLTIFGFAPIFWLEHNIRKFEPNRKLWLFIYGTFIFLGWNCSTVWWIWNATAGGAIAAFLINSLPMVLPLMLYSNLNAKNGKINGLFFISCWISLELLQFYWDLAFPWLVLGNSFANWPHLVQWYEYTGVLGGSTLILLINYSVFKLVRDYKHNNTFKNYRHIFNLIFFGFFTPVFTSYYIKSENKKLLEKPGKEINLVLVQPNIDPYSEKFGSLSPDMQLQKIISLTEKVITPKTQFIILPETALQGGLNEDELNQSYLINLLRNYLKNKPNTQVLSGADTYKLYDTDAERTITARPTRNENIFYDAFNTAILVSSNDSNVQIYHKNKLVPGVEKMPYPAFFSFLEKFAIGLGGTSGSLGSSGESTVFETNHKVKLAPIICYESVFSDFTAGYVVKGADLLIVITNDGWWGNTPGYKQHLNFSRLRSIENRKYLARSANTGITALINPYGEIVTQTQWWQPDAVSVTAVTNNIETFYTKQGDWIAHIALAYFVINIFGLFYSKQKSAFNE